MGTYIAVLRTEAVRDVQFCLNAEHDPTDDDSWQDMPACLPMHAYGLYLTPFDTAAPIVATVNRIQNTNELLAPANVPAVMEFDMPDGTRLQKHCAVNFQTGDIYGVIAPADASDACVIIPFTDKILPCRPGPTPSLKQ